MGWTTWDTASGITSRKKVIISRDVVFNNNTLYECVHSKGSSSNKQPEKEEQVELEETSEYYIIKPVTTPEIGESSGSCGSSNETKDTGSMDDSSS